MFKHSEAFSFQIATDGQAETDLYWNAIIDNEGTASECGWCKDKWGLSWQITPRVLTDAMASCGEVAKRAFKAIMTMQKIDVAKIKDAVKQGDPFRPDRFSYSRLLQLSREPAMGVSIETHRYMSTNIPRALRRMSTTLRISVLKACKLYCVWC